MNLEELELKKIEVKKSTWKYKFAREMEIWEEIAMQINSYTGGRNKKKYEYWCRVMDLYHKKYRK